MNEIVNILKTRDLHGELDFIAGNEVLFEDGNLGIPVMMLKSLYKEAIIQFNHNRKLIRSNNNGNHVLNDQVSLALDASSILIVINPDNHTALNFRKQFLKLLDPTTEINLIKFILTKHASKPNLYYHLYLVYKMFQLNFDSFNVILDQQCERYKCNYASWRYKRQIIGSLNLEQEMETNTKFVSSHLSDCSGWAFRQFLVQKMNEIGGSEEWKQAEQKFVQGLVSFYSKTECIALHIKFLASIH